MSIIKLSLLFVGSDGEQKLSSSFDGRANLSRIHPRFLNALGSAHALGRTRQIDIMNDGHFSEIKEVIALDFYINDVLLSDEFLVVPGLPEEVVIGDATLRKWRIKLDFENEKVFVDPKVSIMQLI